jgi:arylsulfatase A-like enzyme
MITKTIDHCILITIDSLRADHMHCYGYKRDTTPNLDRYAKEGILFRNTFSNAPYTTASIFSLLTSTYPLINTIQKPDMQKSESLAEIFKNADFFTAGVHSNPWFEIYQFNRGFSEFTDPLKESIKNNDVTPFARSRDLNAKVISLLNNSPEIREEQRSFLWVHYMDVHNPYDPKKFFFGPALEGSDIRRLEEKRRKFPSDTTDDERNAIIDLYDNCIRDLDNQITSLITAIGEIWDPQRTLVIITADHGDAFNERGAYGHGGENRPIHMYDYMLHVPLIIWSPSEEFLAVRSGKPGGSVTDNLMGLVDLAPLILDLMNVKKPRAFMGQNPLSNQYRKSWVLSQGIQADDPNDIQQLQKGQLFSSLRTYQHKLLRTPDGDELYDVIGDPNESQNISIKNPEIYKCMIVTFESVISNLIAVSKKNELLQKILRLKKNFIKQ